MIAPHASRIDITRRSLMLAAASLLLAGTNRPGIAAPLIGQPAPPLTVPTLDGGIFDLAALRGHVVLVNFWATWCAPCRAEMPALNAFYLRHHARGLELLGVSVDEPREREKMRRIMARFGYAVALLSEARTNGFGAPDGVPVTYVIDAQGIVRDQFIAVTGKLLAEVVLPLLAEAAGGK